ncbi:tyrosine-type recombinase/integrase [Amnibacterium kyonggiense]|nr:site-specific integrase [Amnibacterium kyonggiense]
MPIGSHGIVNVDEVEPGVWRARTLCRFPDGKRRQIERRRPGRTGAKAIQALQEALVDLATPDGGELRGSTRLEVLAAQFIELKRASERSPRTVDTYEHALRKQIIPRIGDLRVEEATPRRIQAFLNTVNKEHGPGAAKTCRSVLSGMFGVAVRSDVLRSNPISAVESPRRKVTHASMAIPLDGVPAFLETIRADERLRELDISDLFEFMLFTGCRIGEALALRWSHVDLDAATVTFAATAVRTKERGLEIQEHGKTDTSNRIISVPLEVLELLQRREHSAEVVFPSLSGKLRDTNNTEADWRANRVRLGYPTFTSHGLRKTCATALDVAGVSARGIAEYLGHKRPSMTQDVYMSRKVGTAETATHLDRMFGIRSETLWGTEARSAQLRRSGGPRGARNTSEANQEIEGDPEKAV